MIAKSLGLTVVGLCCFLATSIISYAPSASLTSVELKKAWAEDGTEEGVTKKEAQAAKWAAKKEARAAKWAAKKEAQAAKRAAKKNAEGAGTLTQQGEAKASTAPTNTNGRLRLFDPVVWPCATSDDDGSVRIDKKHGTEHLLHTGAYVDACKFFAKVTITSAAVSQSAWAVNNGVVTVNFKVEDKDGKPVVGVSSTASPSRVRFNIAKLVPPSGGNSFNQWVPLIYRTRTGAAGYPNAGTTVEQANFDSGGTLIDYRDGSYSYKFGTNIANVVTPVSMTPIPLERNLTHRIAIAMGGNSGGATANAVFDFVPDGSPVTETRDIVQSTACYACHWEKQFPDHGGDRFTVEVCVTCHNPGTTDQNSGNTVDFKVMLHKIHVGGELASIEETVEDILGPNGNVWQLTDEERFDFYFIGNRNTNYWKIEFPAVIENCTKCHQGSGAQVDNWKNVPSRQACGSCHDTIDFASLTTTHPGGTQTTDNFCVACHPPEGVGFGESVTEAHNWLVKDQRNIAEFDVDLTVSAPGNGQYFVANESPVVTVKLTDVDTGLPVDYLTMTTQSNNAAEGCLPNGCPPRDNKFPGSGLFVHGPRARRVPVLTTPARVELLALNQAMYNLAAVTQNLDMTFDGGKDLFTSSSQLSTIVRANVSVDLTACPYANLATATPTEIMNCLNGNAAFFARGIAYIDEATGRLAIRSRNLGDFYSLQLAPSDANTAVFNNTTIQVMGGSTVSTPLAGNTDPKVTRFADRIEYQLDPVDDLQPGTYMVGVEITDRGRPSTSNYKTPSVKKAYFQVKQAAEEKAIANNCDSCHQGPQGTGFVLDYYRHNKIFDHTAVDQCGQCHDYQSQSATGDPGSSIGWSGSRPINRRVHAVHKGSSLTYPLLTVDYANGDPVNGRNWDITFPQDVRNCETCHPAGETSGTWKTNPSRLPCSGCHDDDWATAHMISMTYDPTPANPWSGDEEPACKTCH